MDQGQKQTRSFEGYSDHDLLVRIATLQEVQTDSINNIRQDVGRLWAEKAQQTDMVLLRAAVENLRTHKADVSTTADHDRRIRGLERWTFMGLGGLFVVEIVLQLAAKYLWH